VRGGSAQGPAQTAGTGSAGASFEEEILVERESLVVVVLVVVELVQQV
jgi:hypothetical protein